MSTLKVDNLLLQNNTTGTGRILEEVSGVCDGRSITTLSGTYSLENVTAINYYAPHLCVTNRVFNYIHSS